MFNFFRRKCEIKLKPAFEAMLDDLEQRPSEIKDEGTVMIFPTGIRYCLATGQLSVTCDELAQSVGSKFLTLNWMDRARVKLAVRACIIGNKMVIDE